MLSLRFLRGFDGSSQKPLTIVGLGCPAKLLILPALGLTSLNLCPKLILLSNICLTSPVFPVPSSKSSTGTSSAGTELVALLESELAESALGRAEDMEPRRSDWAAAMAMGEV